MNNRKGVICKILDPSEMPVNETGVRADVVLDPNATVSRMNLARLYELYLNSASTENTYRLRKMFNVEGTEKDLYSIVGSSAPQKIEKAWQFLMGYYKIMTPKQYEYYTSEEYAQAVTNEVGMDPKIRHITEVLKDGIYLFMPTDNEPEYSAYVKEIENNPLYRPTYGKVRFKNSDGTYTVSKNNVRIASMYMLLLEKTGSDWSATASAKVQQHGILAPISSSDKYSTPARQQPARSKDESGVRNFIGYVGPEITSDLMDRDSNPETHKEIVRNILKAPQPTNIDEIVDRKVFKLGNNRPLQIIHHMAYCSGYKFAYRHMTSEDAYGGEVIKKSDDE